jgi:hypothetical protein
MIYRSARKPLYFHSNGQTKPYERVKQESGHVLARIVP